MKLLQCETCNTLHKRWDWKRITNRRYSLGPKGYETNRIVDDLIINYCPLDPSHKVKEIKVRWMGTNEEMEKFNSYFKPITKEHKVKYKETYMKTALYLDLTLLTAVETLALREFFGR